jgi:Methyltransferase domain
MSCCCGPPGCTDFFNEKIARRDARRYRRKGLDGTAQRLVDFLAARGLASRSVLELGGGVGALQIELLKAGAERGLVLEVSPAYEEEARSLLEEADLAERAERRLADLAEDPEAAGPADAVVMHKVVCCYPDPDKLVGAAAERARSSLALSFPRDRALTRVGFRLLNAVMRLRGSSFRAYVHPVESILGPARERGFRPALEHRGLVWQVAGLERVP